MVDAKEEVKFDLWVLANGCNEFLKNKIKTFPEHKKIQEKIVAKAAAEKAEKEAAEKKLEDEKKRQREKEEALKKKEE